MGNMQMLSYGCPERVVGQRDVKVSGMEEAESWFQYVGEACERFQLPRLHIADARILGSLGQRAGDCGQDADAASLSRFKREDLPHLKRACHEALERPHMCEVGTKAGLKPGT
jgi:hypothetical protein